MIQQRELAEKEAYRTDVVKKMEHMENTKKQQINMKSNEKEMIVKATLDDKAMQIMQKKM